MNLMYLLFSFTTGGTERLVCDICNEMVHRGHNVHLYVVNDLYDESMLQSLNPSVHVCLQKRAVGGGGKFKAIWDVTRYIIDNHIHAVHCNSFDIPEILLLRPLFFPRVKVIQTIHGMGQFPQLSKGKLLLRKILCNSFIAISQCVREDMIAAGAPADRIHVIYNAIDLERFSIPTQSERDDGCFRLGNVARIMPEMKGQDILIDAIALLRKTHPNIHCYFAGQADAAHAEAFAQLKQQVKTLELENNITFLGNVEDVPALLATLDAFVLPSRCEGFGISLVEAMAMGLPCVASDLEGPAEVLNKGQYGLLFQPENPEDLAQKLDQLITHYENYKAQAQQNIAYVKAQYDIKTMCRHLEARMK